MGVLEELNENVKALTAALKAAGVAVPGNAGAATEHRENPAFEHGDGAGVDPRSAATTTGPVNTGAATGAVTWDESLGKDKSGLYHDERIHGKNKSKDGKGNFKFLRGLENREALAAEVKAEQEAYYAANAGANAGDDDTDEQPTRQPGSMFETETRPGPQAEQQSEEASNFDAMFAECKRYMVQFVQALQDNARAAKELQIAFEEVGVSQISEVTEANIGKMHAKLSKMVKAAAGGGEPEPEQPADPLAHMMG